MLDTRTQVFGLAQQRRQLTRLQHKKLSEIIFKAFEYYPPMKTYFPALPGRQNRMRWYFSHVLQAASLFGKVFTNDDLTGALGLLPPSHNRLNIWDYIRSGFFLCPWVMGLKSYNDMMNCEDFVANTQERLMGSRKRWYVWFVAVNPENSRHGIGKRLMKSMLKHTETSGIPVYLETHAEANVAYYEKFGFRLLESLTMPRYGHPLYPMLYEK